MPSRAATASSSSAAVPAGSSSPRGSATGWRARRGRRHADRPQPHACVEAQAARDRRRQHGPGGARGGLSGAVALAPLPLPHRRDDRARPRAPRGAGRAVVRRRGPRGDAAARLRLRHAGHRGRQPEQRLRHAGRRRARAEARVAGRRAALPCAHGQRLHPRPCAGDAAAARAAEGGDHRRRRHRRGAGRRTAPHDARGGGLRARPRRSRQGHQGHA